MNLVKYARYQPVINDFIPSIIMIFSIGIRTPNPLDEQNPSSYTSTVKKQCLINKAAHKGIKRGFKAGKLKNLLLNF
jgi:hypothetical protein